MVPCQSSIRQKECTSLCTFLLGTHKQPFVFLGTPRLTLHFFLVLPCMDICSLLLLDEYNHLPAVEASPLLSGWNPEASWWAMWLLGQDVEECLESGLAVGLRDQGQCLRPLELSGLWNFKLRRLGLR